MLHELLQLSTDGQLQLIRFEKPDNLGEVEGVHVVEDLQNHIHIQRTHAQSAASIAPWRFTDHVVYCRPVKDREHDPVLLFMQMGDLSAL